MKKLLLILLFVFPVFANETVSIVDKDGNIQICKVTPTGTIVCL